MKNYFNDLSFRKKNKRLKKCNFLFKSSFKNSLNILRNKKIVIIGCGAQGINQGLNMRDSGLDISFVLRKESIQSKNISWKNAVRNNFNVDSYENLIPNADLVINLTPDKQHSEVVNKLQKLMKKNSVLGYSHGFNIVEMSQKIRKDITVIMVAPKCPGTEVREEYLRGFGVPTLIAVHNENDLYNIGLKYAKGWAVALGSHKAGVLESSFVAEVKSDLMGEQTILCGMLQTGSIIFYEELLKRGFDPAYSSKLIQYGWEVITESLKHGGIKLMLNRVSNTKKIRICELSNLLKSHLSPLFKKHMDDIMSGEFSSNMIKDWNNADKNLLKWRLESKNSAFENAPSNNNKIDEQEYYDHGILMIATLKAGIELSYEIMLETGIMPESAYYESLHELPLIANTIARKRLYEMNLVISDTAEYGSYLFFNSAYSIFKNFMSNIKDGDLGSAIKESNIDNIKLQNINYMIENHSIEIVGNKLRKFMTKMKKITVANL
ncbi:ketol-acid reductoisomerase [Buchnera aphidicola (Mollitrichosiphum nigrofasciatum)]|uniref:ketol-acid reductoisomerase n=1 Tax=Buchnera aphidicola TaxID=9 RepID=UPI0031B8A1C6